MAEAIPIVIVVIGVEELTPKQLSALSDMYGKITIYGYPSASEADTIVRICEEQKSSTVVFIPKESWVLTAKRLAVIGSRQKGKIEVITVNSAGQFYRVEP